MSKGRHACVWLTLLAASVGGWYLANVLVVWLLKVQAPVAWDTWWRYVQVRTLAPYAAHATKIEMAGYLGFGLPLFGWLMLLVPLCRGKQESLHGEARFADMADLRKAGLLTQTAQSILIGGHVHEPAPHDLVPHVRERRVVRGRRRAQSGF